MRRGVLHVAFASFVLLALGASGLMCGRVAQRGRYAAAYSSYGSGPDGSRALFLLAEHLDMRPERWTRDLGGLPEGGVLVAMGGCDAGMRREMSPFEERALLEWVGAGGVLVVAGVEGYSAEGLGVRLERTPGQCGDLAFLLDLFEQSDATEDEAAPQAFGPHAEGAVEEMDQSLPPMHWARVNSDLFEGLGAVPLREPAMIRLDDGAQATRHLELEGEAAAVSVALGEGMVYMISAASLLQNREMLGTDGGAMMARIWSRHRDAGRVYFDEYHLGIGATRSIVQYTREVGAGAIWLQLLMVLALVFWRRGTRFGSPRARAQVIPGGTASYLESLGRLYRRSADAAAALGIVGAHALRRIARHHHLNNNDPQALAAALEARDEGAAAAVREIERLRGASIDNERELLSHARAIDAIVARQIDHEKVRS